ncbi:MAG TPA: hypothetical protein VKE74_19460 [Gemmataceae bacterium]|nr:hypothetical protein [Gemmataceae bacterium]
MIRATSTRDNGTSPARSAPTQNPAYGTSPLKRKRHRRTKAEIEFLRESIYKVLADDHPMTVRQVFYQLVVHDTVPKAENGYDAVQRQLLVLRRADVVPYSWVADNTRWQRKPRTYTDAEEVLDNAAKTYRRAIWKNQDVYVEVWCEKDALAGVIYQETDPYDVPLMVSRGFSSESYLYETAEAIKDADKPAFIYYFGDRDPSGVKIDPAILRGLERLAAEADITFRRVAVTPEQIETLSLPTRPTKTEGNSHAKGFVGESVELDAVPARTLRQMVRECIEQHIDPWALEVTRTAERSEREIFARLYEAVRRGAL